MMLITYKSTSQNVVTLRFGFNAYAYRAANF